MFLFILYVIYITSTIFCNVTIHAKEGGFIEYESFEEQRYGRNKNTLVNHTYINSGDYRKKFDLITDSKKINGLLYTLAKKMLTHRSGSLFEDMYWLDMDKEKVIASETNNSFEKRIIYSKKTQNIIKNNHNIITMHSHPYSYPPSINDFNSNYLHGYNLGIICCHDGKIFVYNSNSLLPETDYKIAIAKQIKKGYNGYEIQQNALLELMQGYDIYFEEVLL